jgi:hypothetical protein
MSRKNLIDVDLDGLAKLVAGEVRGVLWCGDVCGVDL